MSEFEIINEVPQWTNDGLGCVDIIHKTDAKKDLHITQDNCKLTNEEIVKIYAYSQEHPDFKDPDVYSTDKGRVISGGEGENRTEIKIKDLPSADVPELTEALNEGSKIKLSWVADLKRAARDGVYVCITDPLSPERRAEYADLFKKNFENWAKQSHTQKMTLNKYDYNSVCYVGPNKKLKQNPYGIEGNGVYNPLLKGQMVATGSAESDFADRLTEVLKEGNLEYVEIAERFECNGVMICTFDDKQMEQLKSALPNSFSQKNVNKYDKTSCFINFKNFDIGKTEKEQFEAFNTACEYNQPGVAAQIIKENPHFLESENIRRKLTNVSTYDLLDESAFKLHEFLKVLKDKKVISEDQLSKAINTQSPDTGETFLTYAVKYAVDKVGHPISCEEYLELIDKSLSVGLDCNVPNARGQYPLELIRGADVYKAGRIPGFAKVIEKIDEATNPVTKVRINKIEPHPQVDIIDDKGAKRGRGHVSDWDFGEFYESYEKYEKESSVWVVKVECPSYLASDIQKPTDIATILPKGEYVIATGSSCHISSIEEFKAGQKHFYVAHKDGKGKKVPAEKIVSTIMNTFERTGHSNEL